MERLEFSPFYMVFDRLRRSINDILAISVTDKAGVPLLTVCDESFPKSNLRNKNFDVAKLVFEQSDKLGFGTTNYTISFYNNHQVISFNKDKLIVTIIATAEANTGHIMSMEKEFSPTVKIMFDALENDY